ncbi:MAG: CHAT domain-containing protein [Cyclobacteriaceae bacterium]|nr:CHAT domain-containing protein [Cyclobacteriaceae bacterium]
MKRQVLLGLFFSVSLGLAGQDCQRLYDQAYKLYQADKYDEAIKAIDKSLATCKITGATDTVTHNFFRLKGLCFFYKENYKQAKSELLRSTKELDRAGLQFTWRRVWLNLGDTYRKLNQMDSAAWSYSTGIGYYAGTPANEVLADLLYKYGELLKERERYEEASVELVRATHLYDSLQAKDKCYDALDYLAEVTIDLQRYELAKTYLSQQESLLTELCNEKLIDREECATNYSLLGSNYFDANDNGKAARMYETSESLYAELKGKEHLPDWLSTKIELSRAYLDNKEVQKADSKINEALQLALSLKDEESQAYCFYVMGDIQLAEGKLDLAEKSMLESKRLYEKIDPGSDNVSDAYKQLAKLYKKQNLLVKEGECLVAYVALKEKNFGATDSYATALRSLASAYAASGQFMKAEKAYLEAISIYYAQNEAGMNYESALEALGHLYRRNDQYDRADSAYQLCKELYEFNKEVGVEYGNLFYFMALNSNARGDNQTAIDQLKESLTIIREKAGKQQDYFDALHQIAGVYQSNGDYVTADRFYRQALSLADSLKRVDSKVVSLRSLGGLYFGWGKKEAAFRFKRQALQLARQQPFPSLAIANAEFELGALHRLVFQFDSALFFYKRVQTAYLHEFGTRSTEYASILYQLAQTYYYLGTTDSTETILKRRLEIFKMINPKSVSMASGLFHLGEYYGNVGNVKEAEKLFLQSYNLESDLTGPTLSLAGKLGSIGWFHMNLGNYTDAEKYYKQAMAMVESINGKECVQYGARLNEMGTLYKLKGLYAKSEDLLTQYLQIEERKRGPGSSGYAIAKNNLGSLYDVMGLESKALQYYLEAAKINEAIYGRDSEEFAFYASNAAGAYRDLKNYKKADSLYAMVVAIRSKYFGPHHPKTIGTISSLALFEKLRGRYQQSSAYYDAVIENRKRAYGDQNLNTLYAVEGKGDLLTKMGSYRESVALLQSVIPVYKASLGENHPSYSGINRKLGVNFLNQRDFKSAARYFKTMLDVRFFQIDKTFSSLTERQREDFYAAIKLDFNLFNAFALIASAKVDYLGKSNPTPDTGLIEDLYNNQIATKALLLSSTARLRKQIISGSDKVLKEKFFEWEKLKAQLASYYQKGEAKAEEVETSTKKAIRDSLEFQVDKLERELSIKSERFAKAEDKKRYTWKDIQQKLKPGEAAIEIIRIQKYGHEGWTIDGSDPKEPRYANHDLTDTIVYAALVVTPQTLAGPELVLFPEGNAMETSFLKVYQNSIYQREDDLQSYGRFWKPIAEHPSVKGKVKKIFLSPDGIYNQISINSLKNPATRQFVVDEMDVQLVTNSRDILVAKKADELNYYCLFIGNPSFYAVKKLTKSAPGTQSYSLTRGGTLSSLPGAEREVDLIGDLLDSASSSWQKDILKGKEATEQRIKTMDNPRVLHIATHGFFEQSAGVPGTRGAVVEVDDSKSVASGPQLNPMLASGLFLGGGGDALASLKTFDYELLDRDDGILTAYEAMNLNIENTELVVLSACETGLGEVSNGEGVYGLQRALRVAGANSIVMSLWSVSDDATMVLMHDFYKYWLASGDKQAAFRKAQLAVRNTPKFSHPFFWSAFVMVGN